MPSLWFCVPVHGRLPLARVCLRQLRRTCDELTANGIEATAVLVGDKWIWQQLADELGFAFVERDNAFLSRKFNDGIQLACDPELNPRPADYVMPFGSDDWIDYRLLLDLPGSSIMAFRKVCVVRPDGKEMTARFIDTDGGPGIRMYPREVVKAMDYRPADEDRNVGCDTSMLINIGREVNYSIVYRQTEPRQIVDWKSEKIQVTPYHKFVGRRVIETWPDPFEALAGRFPTEALEEMRGLFA